MPGAGCSARAKSLGLQLVVAFPSSSGQPCVCPATKSPLVGQATGHSHTPPPCVAASPHCPALCAAHPPGLGPMARHMDSFEVMESPAVHEALAGRAPYPATAASSPAGSFASSPGFVSAAAGGLGGGGTDSTREAGHGAWQSTGGVSGMGGGRGCCSEASGLLNTQGGTGGWSSRREAGQESERISHCLQL